MKRENPAEQAPGPKKRLPLARAGFPAGLLLTVPLAALETALALTVQPGSVTALCAYLWTQPLLAFLNYLPFLLLTLCFYFLFSDPFYAAALAGGIGGVLSLVSRTMVEKRDEPLTPKDFGLIKEAGSAVKSYGMDLHWPSVLEILCFLAVMILLGKLFRGRRPFRVRWKNLCLAVGGALAAFGVLAGCIQLVYSSKELYNSFPVTNRSYITSVYNELGFPYCFCYNFNAYLVEKPEGFSAREAEGYAGEHPETKGAGEEVNVVMVMDEAFSDVTNEDVFAYPEGEEPLKFYNSLGSCDRAVTGHIVAPNFGAGTANAEFDVLTGMQTTLIAESAVSAFRVLNHDMDSLFRVYGEDGYQTEFIHPGQDWFYNRQNVYRYFGAEKLLFSEAFADADRKGDWVSDYGVLLKIEEEFEAAMEQGGPWFNYTVTIQNHMSYTEEKYGDEKDWPLVELNTEVEPDARTMLSVYAEGVRDADAMLEGLTEYFDGRDEPVVLVFFGDHRPNLGDSYYCYEQLGIDIGEGKDAFTTLYTYETPYVIWVNEAAEEVLDFQARKETLGLPEDNTINANYLGALTLELTGRRDSDSFFSYLNDLRRELPVLHNGVGRTGDGTYFDEAPEEYADDLQKLRWWQYYKLKVE